MHKLFLQLTLQQRKISASLIKVKGQGPGKLSHDWSVLGDHAADGEAALAGRLSFTLWPYGRVVNFSWALWGFKAMHIYCYGSRCHAVYIRPRCMLRLVSMACVTKLCPRATHVRLLMRRTLYNRRVKPIPGGCFKSYRCEFPKNKCISSGFT